MESRYGINAHVPNYTDMANISKAGFQWIRIDMTWAQLEPRENQFKWDVYDTVINNAMAYGIGIIGILGYSPRWVSSGDTIFYPPKSIERWQDFVTTVTQRYKGKIDHWCLWNEPNNNGFFNGTVDQFIDGILIPGAAAAKQGNPACKIVGPDLAHFSNWDEWMKKILSRAGSCIDIITHHIYKDKASTAIRMLCGWTWPWEPKSVKSMINSLGYGKKPFWLTESGSRSNQVGEDGQSKYLIDMMRAVYVSNWIKKYFIYELNDSPTEVGFGLIKLDRTKKSSFSAIRRFISSQST